MIDEQTACYWKQKGREACRACPDPLNAEAAYAACLSAYLFATVPLGNETFMIEVAMEFAWGWEQALQGETARRMANG